jgi:hypothetical protein
VASVLNVQQVAAAVTATAAPNGTAVVLTTLGNASGDNVDNASVSTSANRITAIADGAVASNSMTVSGTSLAVFDGAGGTDGLSSVSSAGLLTTDAAFTLMNRQEFNTTLLPANRTVTATLRDATTDSARVLTDVAGIVTGSRIVSNGNLLTALASSLKSSNSLVLDGTALRTTGALLNSQDSVAVVDALIGRNAATNVGGVTITIGGDIDTSTVAVDDNVVQGSAIANVGTNVLAVSATSITGDGASATGASASADGSASTADADYVLLNDQKSTAGSSTAIVNNSFSIDQSNLSTASITDSSLSVSDNRQLAEAGANTSSNSLMVSAGALLNASAALGNDQTNNVAASASSTATVSAILESLTTPNALNGSSVAIVGNSSTAVARGNRATNAMTYAAGADYGSSNTGATITGSTSIATGSAVVLNAQTNTGSIMATSSADYILDLTNNTGPTNAGVLNSSVRVGDNMNNALAFGNSAVNSMGMTALNTGMPSAAVSSSQTNGAAVAASVSGNFEVIGPGTVNGSNLTASGNMAGAQAIGNSMMTIAIIGR